MRLLLGPIIGYTNTESTRIWVQASEAVERLRVRIEQNYSTRDIRFESTEAQFPPSQRIFNTGVCTIHGLKPGMRYRFSVVEGGGYPRTLAWGSFRTMQPANSRGSVMVVSTSCSGGNEVPAEYFGWPNLRDFIDNASPDYLLLTGDQVYTDSGDAEVNVWRTTLQVRPAERLRAFVDMYQLQWGRDEIREVMASLPVAMMWDDHDIRDGWGSRPGDTDTLLKKYPKGRPIFDLFQAYYKDARTAFWHFQRCHGPIGPFDSGGVVPGVSQSERIGTWSRGAPAVSLPAIDRRSTVGYWFDVGAARVVMFDGRSARAYFREPDENAPDAPVLRVNGEPQWRFVNDMLRRLPRTTRAVLPMTSVPIVANSSQSIGESALGDYEPDVAPFGRGDLAGLLETFGDYKPKDVYGYFDAVVSGDASVLDFKRELVDDLRDGWVAARNREEGGRLLRLFAALEQPGRPGTPMPVTFLGGDIHVGALFRIELAGGRVLECAIGSAIAKEPVIALKAGLVVGTDFTLPSVGGVAAETLMADLRLVAPNANERLMRRIHVEILGDALRQNNYAVTRIDLASDPVSVSNDIVTVQKSSDIMRLEVHLGPYSVSTT